MPLLSCSVKLECLFTGIRRGGLSAGSGDAFGKVGLETGDAFGKGLEFPEILILEHGGGDRDCWFETGIS